MSADRPVWGENASQKRVVVTYRVKGQQQTTTRTMDHNAYIRWAMEHEANGYQFISAEQES